MAWRFGWRAGLWMVGTSWVCGGVALLDVR